MSKKIFLILFLFFSCTSNKDNDVSITTEVSLENTICDLEKTELFFHGDYPEKKWWKDLEDENLSYLIEQALAGSPGLLSVKEKVEAANQTALEVRSKLFPDIAGLFQYGWLYVSDNNFIRSLLPALADSNFLYNLAFDFNYELDIFGRNWKRYQAYLGSAKAARLHYEQSKVILSTSIATCYSNLVAMEAKKTVLERMLAQKKRYLELITLRIKNRLDNKIDEHTFTQKVKNIEESIRTIKKEIVLESSLVNIFVGRNPQEEITITSLHKIFNKNLMLPKNITSTFLVHRPDLLSSLWITKKHAREVGVSVRNFLPEITVADIAALISGSASQFFSSESFTNFITPKVIQPIFTGGRLRANWKKNIALYKSSVYEFNDLFLKAAKELHDSINVFIEADQKQKIQEEKIALAKKNYNLEYLRFENGISSMLPVIEYDEIYLQNKILLIERDRLKKNAYISFIKSLGGGFQEGNGTDKK